MTAGQLIGNYTQLRTVSSPDQPSMEWCEVDELLLESEDGKEDGRLFGWSGKCLEVRGYISVRSTVHWVCTECIESASVGDSGVEVW